MRKQSKEGIFAGAWLSKAYETFPQVHYFAATD